MQGEVAADRLTEGLLQGNAANSHRISANTNAMPHNPSVKNQKIFDSSLYTREPWALPRQCNNLNLTKGCDCVKKKTIILTIVLVTLVVVFFPTSTTHSISGNGEVLTLQKEKIGDCNLQIEVTEISSLVIRYKKSFSFVIDGKSAKEFSTTSHCEAEGICLISQMYYDQEIEEPRLCTLIYKDDFSYAVLRLGMNYYFINNGSDITYDALPVS